MVTAQTNSIVPTKIDSGVIIHLQTMQSKYQTQKCFSFALAICILGVCMCVWALYPLQTINADKFYHIYWTMDKKTSFHCPAFRLHSLSHSYIAWLDCTVVFFLDQPIFVVCFTILVIYLTRTVAIDNDDKITILRQSRKKISDASVFLRTTFSIVCIPNL